MNTTDVKKKVYRISPSMYWQQHWSLWPIGIIATSQLIMAFGVVSMEIGNAEVDLFRANIYTGFWSFPFMILAIMATYTCVCTKKTQIKAIIALIFQLISIIVMIIVIGFLMAFIATNYKLCLGFQCSLSSSTSFSTSTYNTLKQAFISCELACSIIYIVLSIIYIIRFIKCYQKLPRIHPLIQRISEQNSFEKNQLSNLSRNFRPWTESVITYNQTDIKKKKQIRVLSSLIPSYNGVQKICPNCKFISLYIPQEDLVQCPKCGYQSSLVEHAQQ